ncbi:MAG: hypothetical protein HUK19_02980 [Fibrobacter sp.]|nr:hypothetical protein [Fibrobacter sp.]
MARFFLVAIIFSFTATAFARVEKMPDFKDKRDGRVYKTVQIGAQRWMAENLRFPLKGSYCYEGKEYNCDKYGRLYNWAMGRMLVDYYNNRSIKKIKEINSIHDVCPMGWHIPSNKEWKTMKAYVGKTGKSDGVGLSLKSTEYWDKELRMPGGSDEFGFNAIPAGERYFIGTYIDQGASAQFWASNEMDAGGAYFWRLTYDSRTFEQVMEGKDNAVSIRCVEDKLYEIKEPPPPPVKVVTKVMEVQGRKIETVHIGNQVWMANNLDIKAPDSYCFEDKEENCQKYGRLYTWASVVKLSSEFNSKVGRDSISKVKPKGVCPNGWHVPTFRDFYRLDSYLKDIDDAVGVGVNLRSRTGWDDGENSIAGENGFGFNGLALGARSYTEQGKICTEVIKEIIMPTVDGPNGVGATPDTIYADSCVLDTAWVPTLAYQGIGKFTGFWSATEADSAKSVVWKLSFDEDDFVQDSVGKEEAYYLRCIMDPPDDDELYDGTEIHDKRDDVKYRTVTIGNDTWMSENLRYAAPGSFCYEDKDIRCRSYGRLYTWTTAMRLPSDYVENSMSGGILEEHQGICPEGWHIPTNEEWIALGQTALNMRRGGIGSALKSKEGWARGGAPISAVSGFNVLPSGSRFAEGEYAELGSSAYFWAAHGGDGMGAVYWNVINSKDDFTSMEDFDNFAFSVRCVKNKLTATKDKSVAEESPAAE